MKTKKHSHKKPLLQEQVSHRERLMTNIMGLVSMMSFGLMMAYIFAGVFD